MRDVEERVIRGYAIIAKGDALTQLDENVFKVPSQSGNGSYEVSRVESGWVCSCPDHVYRRVECKHIHAVRFWLVIKERVSVSTENMEAIRCKWCSSIEVIRYGHDARKQVYRCKICRRKFVVDDGFKKLKYDPKIITVTLDLYFKGVSLRKIVDHLKQFYGLNVNFTSIYYWIKRYVKLLETYVNSLEPQLSKTWRADEMMVKVKGEWQYLWNVMDDETRFILASQISKNRSSEDARRVFAKAKAIAKTIPHTIVTDGLPSYIGAYVTSPEDMGKIKHIRHIRLSGHPNNNLIERLQGTKRERDKVLRGMKTETTPIREGFDIYYNYIRPHQALNGKTPAEKANINLELGGNRWMELIKKSLNHHS